MTQTNGKRNHNEALVKSLSARQLKRAVETCLIHSPEQPIPS
jgi:hypothetical protein